MKTTRTSAQFVSLLTIGLALLFGWPGLALRQGAVGRTSAAAATVFTTITVDTADDDDIVNGNCTLREAIIAANTDTAVDTCAAGSGTDTIAFAIPGAGPHTIAPTSSLPIITAPVIIDGTTQPGASCTTAGGLKIEINGESSGGYWGLYILANGSTVKGLVINRSIFGLLIEGSGNTVSCNYIGTNVAGTASLGNLFGVRMDGAGNNLLGGTSAGQGNLISGNLGTGVTMLFTANNTIQGNLIGTNAAGTESLGNGGSGLVLNSTNNTLIGGTSTGARNVIASNNGNGIELNDCQGTQILGNYIGTDSTGNVGLGNVVNGIQLQNTNDSIIGGTVAGARNLISGNGVHGLLISGSLSTSNQIQGNYIGTNAAGTEALGNQSGIFVHDSAANNQIGGTTSGAGNRIAFNTGSGVVFFGTAGMGNSTLANTIVSNSGLGIDLYGDGGVTANDSGDGDTGPNNLQNFPLLNPITAAGTVSGSLDSTVANSAYPIRLEFFANTACDSSGNGEGDVFLGALSIGAPGSFTFNYTPVGGKPFITATATDANGNTSEFSACRQVGCLTIAVNPASLQNLKVGVPYSQMLTGSGGSSPYSFEISAGYLPPGLSIDNSSSIISGTPIANGTFNFTIRATDVLGCTGTQIYTINVSDVCPTITVFPSNSLPLPFGFTGTSYIPVSLSASGGASPYTFSAVAGTLPPGITPQLVSGFWRLTGTPTTQGAFNFTLQATDANGCTGTRPYTLIVYGNTPTLTVTTTADEDGTNPAACSLREAITAANTNAAYGGCGAGQVGYDVIKFALPTAAAYAIAPGPLPLPYVTEPVFIDGSTGDPQFPRVELSGVNATQNPSLGEFPNGLSFRTALCYAKSLVINRFNREGFGIELNNSDLSRVEDCYLGTDATGSTALGNKIGIGLVNGSDSNRIGGTGVNQPNLISGNLNYGVYLNASIANSLAGNRIGTNLAGTAGISNGDAGMAIFNTGNLSSNTISSNTIAYNNTGVLISGSLGTANRNRITANRIFANAGLGIDLVPSAPGQLGVTPNDGGDADEGPNRLQNFPVLNPITTPGTVTGSVDTLATSASYPLFVDFYANSSCDSSGQGEGEQFLAEIVLSNATAASNFSFTYTPVAGKPFITAAAFDASGNTSEFSACVSANQPPTITLAPAVVKQQGGSASNHLLATVSDPNQAANSLNLALTLASGTGVALSNIAVNASGQVMADVIALCTATNSTFTLTVTDAGGLMATANLTITVQPNTPPTINGATITAQKGSVNSTHQIVTVNDFNQTKQSLAVQINGGSSATNDNVTVGNLSVDTAGNVTAKISVACDATTTTPRNFTLTVTDNCGLSASSMLTVNLAPNTKPALSYNDQTVAVGGTLTVNPATGPSDNGTFIIEFDKVQPKTGVTVTVHPVTGAVSITNVTKADVYKIDINITDNCNLKTSATFKVTVTTSALAIRAVKNDFDGDRKSDMVDWNPESGAWRIRRSSDGELQIEQWGAPGDVPVHADYDGDGKADLAVWRAAEGQWLIKRSNDGETLNVVLGERGDTPAPGDYDGDGKADVAIWRAGEGTWLIHRSSDAEEQRLTFGAGDEVAVPGDYDGDGKLDPALWRPSGGQWLIKLSGNDAELEFRWGVNGDVPVPADYDGDGKTDIAVWRGRIGVWLIRHSADVESQNVWCGRHAFGDVPVPGDYDGDGKTDAAVWRAVEGTWYISDSAANLPLQRIRLH